MASSTVFDDIINVVDSKTQKVENFLSVQDNVALTFRGLLKSLYDFTKEESKRKTDALPELLIDGFDEEQIWQQLELQNEGEWSHLLTGVSKGLRASQQLTLPIKLRKETESDDNKETTPDSEEDELPVDDSQASSDDYDDEDDENAKRKKKQKKVVKRTKIRPSVVDDKFFKLQELDEYLSKEDKKATSNTKPGEKKGDDSDDESIDLFNAYSDDHDDEEDETVDDKMAKFRDFFDKPHSEDEAGNGDDDEDLRDDDEDLRDDDEGVQDDDENAGNDSDGDQFWNKERDISKNSDKRVKFNLLGDDNEDSDDASNEQSVGKRPEIKSTLEERQERLQRKIEELEEAAISEKPWQLKGEVDAASRPQNSLLEEHVEFDITSRPAPVITEQTTLKLEDVIRQRIKDKAWDDVEKKFKPVETPLEYKKKLILDQEKSKVSLAQIYENEYLKQKEATNLDNDDKEEEEPKEHIEIRSMMKSLFAQLDALSNFHYTPKMAKPEIKIVSNVPAITMEEVAPLATSDATLLAPEEVKAKNRGDIIGKTERTDTDMKRERRKKKLQQREREKAKEKRDKVVAKLRPGLGNKYSKEKTKKMIDNLSKERNISKIDETGSKSARSSTAFFNELQDQVKSHIKLKTGKSVKSKKDKNAVSAVKLKL